MITAWSHVAPPFSCMMVLYTVIAIIPFDQIDSRRAPLIFTPVVKMVGVTLGVSVCVSLLVSKYVSRSGVVFI